MHTPEAISATPHGPTSCARGKERGWRALIGVLMLGTVIVLHGYRFAHIDGDLIYRHSYGESQYAEWAKGYADEGFFWGIREVDRYSPIVSYFPLTSLLAAGLHKPFALDLVVAGRFLAFLAGVAAAAGFYLVARRVFEDRSKALTALLLFSALPVNMYFSKTFYNDPVHLALLVFFTLGFMTDVQGEAGPRTYAAMAILFTLILLTKASTLLLCLPLLLLHACTLWRRREPVGIGRLCAYVLPVVCVGCVLLITRWLHSDAYMVESNKLLNTEVMDQPLRYLRLVAAEFYSEFGYTTVFCVIGCMVAVVRPGVMRYFVLMVLGFLVFYAALLRGALVHQYYLLPLTLPFALLVCHGFFWLYDRAGHRLTQLALAALLLLAVGETTLRLDEAFAPVYSQGIVEVAQRLQDLPEAEMTLVLGGTCRIFQYYLSVPTALIKCDQDAFLQHADLSEYFTANSVRYVVAEEHGNRRHDLLANQGFRFLLKSEQGRGVMRYVVYQKP